MRKRQRGGGHAVAPTAIIARRASGVGGQWQTKLIYVGCSLAIFVISGAYRKLIAALGVIAFFGLILLCACNYGVTH